MRPTPMLLRPIPSRFRATALSDWARQGSQQSWPPRRTQGVDGLRQRRQDVLQHHGFRQGLGFRRDWSRRGLLETAQISWRMRSGGFRRGRMCMLAPRECADSKSRGSRFEPGRGKSRNRLIWAMSANSVAMSANLGRSRPLLRRLRPVLREFCRFWVQLGQLIGRFQDDFGDAQTRNLLPQTLCVCPGPGANFDPRQMFVGAAPRRGDANPAPLETSSTAFAAQSGFSRSVPQDVPNQGRRVLRGQRLVAG